MLSSNALHALLFLHPSSVYSTVLFQYNHKHWIEIDKWQIRVPSMLRDLCHGLSITRMFEQSMIHDVSVVASRAPRVPMFLRVGHVFASEPKVSATTQTSRG